jgi:hypothetical protein
LCKRKHASFDALRPHDIVSINFETGHLFFFADAQGNLTFKDCHSGKKAFKTFFANCEKKEVKHFLREKAEKARLKMTIFDETSEILEISFQQ